MVLGAELVAEVFVFNEKKVVEERKNRTKF